MVRRPAPLPEDAPEVFRVQDALAGGVPRGRLFRGDLARPHHGVRSSAGPDATDERESVWDRRRRDHIRSMRELHPVLSPSAYFCGPSAALLWEIPLPAREWRELHVGMPRPARTPRRPGVVGHQHSEGYVAVSVKDGFRVTDPASTWATLGGLLGMDALTVAADRVLRTPRMPGGFRMLQGTALATREELARFAERKGRPGAPMLRLALEWARDGSSSAPESRIRLLIRDAGLPEPELDHDVYDRRGRFIGCSELAYPDRRIAIEYESDGHLTRPQLQRDVDKYQAYAEAGWTVIRLTARHVSETPWEAVRRIRSALRTA
ncbi:hypothetical protein [Microbacterium sp.]|uniref:hypothetical protein n=1 Tax=Microbacterium sp. TaxID=51671 RepID=UPI003341B366